MQTITDQAEMKPLCRSEVALLEYLIRDYERLLDDARSPSQWQADRATAEKAGLATAIAYMTGLHFIATPEGGVQQWLPTLKHVISISTVDTLGPRQPIPVEDALSLEDRLNANLDSVGDAIKGMRPANR